MTCKSRFSTDEVFRSREDLMTWVQDVARSLGFVIVTIRSRASSLGYIYNIVLGCERGGVSRSKDPAKDIGTKKINCPFELVGKYSKTHDVWKLKVVRDEHNHPPALYMEGHAQAMKLSSNENCLVQDLTRLNVKPRDILSTLKKQNTNNVSVLKTIYNARYRFRKTEQAGRTLMQNLMYTLQSKGYVFEYRTHDITNELEELFFVHPTSLIIWQAFPYVVLMDATYKTNKYNLPFLEIVGVAYTNKTFSIAFAFMNKEKANNYIWPLTRLKLTINESFCPRVIVTDRDLALMKACAEVFPQSNHLLCRWHIQNDIVKHCRPRIRSQQTWVHFLSMWNTLVTSPTNIVFMQGYADLQALLFGYPGVLQYLHTTWLDQYAERFVSLWTDKHINFVNSTTNRVESQHAKLKKHLDTTKCDLDRFILVIEDIVKSQETAIKESLERSRSIRKKKYNYPIFQKLHDFVSHHAMNIILAEIHRSNGFVLNLDNCGCQVRSCFGLPCAHELATYASAGLAIPLDCIDPFWTKLDLLPSIGVEYGDLGYEKNMELFKETFNKQSNAVKSSLLRKLKGVFDPATNRIVEPVVKKNNRGRPNRNQLFIDTVPHRHSCSNFGGLNFQDIKQEPARHSTFSYPDFQSLNQDAYNQSSFAPFYDFMGLNQSSQVIHEYIDQIPEIFRPYVTRIHNVLGDGNYGFRAIASALGYGEDQWLSIRIQLMEELMEFRIKYARAFCGSFRNILTSLDWSGSYVAPEKHWMIMPESGFLIANKFNVIVHFISEESRNSSTCFPLWRGPGEFLEKKIITIARVNGNHFIMVELHGEYPIANTNNPWTLMKERNATGWENIFKSRQNMYNNWVAQPATYINID